MCGIDVRNSFAVQISDTVIRGECDLFQFISRLKIIKDDTAIGSACFKAETYAVCGHLGDQRKYKIRTVSIHSQNTP